MQEIIQKNVTTKSDNYCILYTNQKTYKTNWHWHLIDIIQNIETIFMNTEYSRTREPHGFILYLIDKLNLNAPEKNMALVNLSIYYTWKNIQSEYNNNKFKTLAQI